MKLYEIVGATPGKTILQVDGRKLVDTYHAYSRYESRFTNSTNKQAALAFLKKVMHKLVEDEDQYGDSYILAFSKSLNQGFILAFNKDRIKSLDDDKRHVFIVTVLPRSRQQAKEGTKKIVLESYYKDSSRYSDKFISYISSILPDNAINEETEQYEYHPVQVSKGLNLFFCENKIFDISCQLIELS